MRPRLDRDLVRWLRVFARRCDEEHWQSTTLLARDLIRASQALFAELGGDAFGYQRSGLVALYRSQIGFEQAIAHAAKLERLGITAEPLDRQSVERRIEGARGRTVGAIFYPEDAHLDPALFVGAMAQRARATGVELITGAEVVAMHRHGDLLERIELADGVIEPQEVVLAAGAWTPTLGRWLGLGAVQPAKGYSITLPSNTDIPKVPLRLGEDKMTVTPVSGGRRLTGKLDLVGLRTTIERRRIRDLPSQATRYVQIDALSDKATHWAGLRPLTPDGLPIIGRHHLVSNVILATGHGMLGIALAPLTGRVVGELANGRPTIVDLSPYRSDRFQSSA